MKDNNILANAICEFVKRSKKKGLVEIPLPTGFGKTHAVMQAMSVMADRETGSYSDCQEWIMKALNDHKVLSRKQINELLWNKLPIDYTDDQRVRKIGNLLTKLRKNGVIYTDENRLWHLNENLSDFKRTFKRDLKREYPEMPLFRAFLLRKFKRL